MDSLCSNVPARVGPQRAPVVVVAVAVALLATGIALACSRPPPPRTIEGILGSPGHRSIGSDYVLPRNFAIVESMFSVPPPLEDGTVLTYSAIDGLPGLARVDAPVMGGARIVAALSNEAATIGDFIDTTPPGAVTITGGRVEAEPEPVVSGCQSDSCGNVARVFVAVTVPTDDHTPADRMTYALFLGRSATDVESATAPDGFFARAGSELWHHLDAPAEADHDVFAAVIAVDLAGNVGPRSAAVQIHHGAGCRVAGRNTLSPWVPPLFAIVLLARRSTRSRRRVP